MAKKPQALKPPSQQTIERVLTAAFNSPQRNCGEAQQTLMAIEDVAKFFRVLYNPASDRAAADGGVSPQASAINEGSPSSQA